MTNRRNLFITLVNVAFLLMSSMLVLSQVDNTAPESASAKAVTGVLLAEDGSPWPGAIIEVHSSTSPASVHYVVSDANGVFTLNRSIISGEVLLKIERPGCGRMVRKFPSADQLLQQKTLYVTIPCFEPVPPIKAHKKYPGVSHNAYAGSYLVTTISDGAKSSCSTLQLTNRHKNMKAMCNCGNTSFLVVESYDNGCKSYGCWKVQEDGDIVVTIPCGAAFGGSNYTLWKEGNILVGQGTSWSDVGGGGGWDIVLERRR